MSFVRNVKKSYDALVVGGGHNGLVAACYLKQAGLNVLVLERRHVIGGAAVTEEIIPGYKFSRCSYLLSLLRPVVYEDLELKKYGLKLHFRDPYSFTPIRSSQKSLLLGLDRNENHRQISQFSKKDADSFVLFEHQLNQIVDAVDPLMDIPPPQFRNSAKRLENFASIKELIKACYGLRKVFPEAYDLLTAPIAKVLNNYFESEPLKATLGTDGLIGSPLGPYSPGTGYVLLHHVMGRLEGRKGAWAYVEGGMGMVSETIAKVLRDRGGEICTDAKVEQILLTDGKAVGVRLDSGQEIFSRIVLSNATARETMLKLLPDSAVPESLRTQVSQIDYSSPVVKINVALSRIPDFSHQGNIVQPHHRCSIHLNCESLEILDVAQKDYVAGRASLKPMIEMVIPSSLDTTLAPPGCHVALLFVQYVPYSLSAKWNSAEVDAFAQSVFKEVEEYAPGFISSIVGYETLTPKILEDTFSLTGGNIFHGGLSWDQLFIARPLMNMPGYRTPVSGLYLCGSSCHPGGGVSGSPGRLSALTAISDL